MCKAKRILAIMVLSAFMIGCKTSDYMEFSKKVYQAMGNMKLVEKDKKVMDFRLKDDRILFLGSINGKADTVQFDTGVSAPIVQFVTPKTAGKRQFYDYPVTTVEASTSQIGVEEIDLGFPFYDLHSYSLFYLLENGTDCENLNSIDEYALVGSGSLLQFGNILKMDFTNGKMELLSEDYTVDTNEYKLIEGHYFQGIPFVKITIDGKEYECIFDTGNQAGVLLKDTERIALVKDSDYAYEGSYGLAASGTTASQKFIIAPEEKVTMCGLDSKNFVLYVENVSFNNVGIGFIQNFDWILDTYNQKIYAKNRNLDYKTPIAEAQYRTTINNGNIVIINRLLNNRPIFSVGDIIDNVDGVTVTEENICDIQEKLSKSVDWSGMKIRVRQ